jgi:hypothetical protein
MDVSSALRVCSFSLIVLVIGGLIFHKVAQGAESLRVIGEGAVLDKARQGWRLAVSLVALTLWAVSSWYTARVLLYFDFPRRLSRAQQPAAKALVPQIQQHLPRLLGAGPFFVVGTAILAASTTYAGGDEAKYFLTLYGWVCAVLGLIFYALLVARRKLIGGVPTHPMKTIRDLPKGTWAGLSVLALASAAMLTGTTVAPVAWTSHIETAAIFLFAAASWCCFGAVLIFAGARWDLPVIKALLVVAVVSSCWNDNHRVRLTSDDPKPRQDTLQAFEHWYALIEKGHPGAMHPCYIVAAEGGGIRAAYWTAVVLGTIQDQNEEFSNHLFAISGVSGGSLGASVFVGLLGEPKSETIVKRANGILGQDFLSPAIAAMLYPDLLQRFIPIPFEYLDRSRALEKGWEEAWRRETGNGRFAEPFMNIWGNGGPAWVPALFLNATSVEKGNRIIASNVRITSAFLDADDLAERLRGPQSSAANTGPNVSLSTATHMSARFTFVSPAGLLGDGTHVVDGGYFENAGATTAYEIASRIKSYCEAKRVDNVDVKVIMIGNNPRKLPGDSEASLDPKTQLSQSTLMHGSFLGELSSPLWAIINTRDAHGTYAQQNIRREQRRWRASAAQAQGDTSSRTEGEPDPNTPDIIYFGLADRNVPLPLGWTLSSAAARDIAGQVNVNLRPVTNQASLEDIMSSLPSNKP